jgi:hypothetical protein
VSLAIESPGAALGASPMLAVTTTGPTAGLELVLTAIAPGAPGAQGPRTLDPGLAPANGKARSFDGSGWQAMDAAVPLSTTSVQGPVLDASGEWRFVAVLRGAGGGEPVAMASKSVVAGNSPSARLTMNRLAASTTDLVTAEVTGFVGTSTVPLAISARLRLPDGSTRDLLGGANVIPLDPGGAVNLLSRDFTSTGPGSYRLVVRLLEGTTGALLRMAEARFSICDSPTTISGHVKAADGHAIGSGAPLFASVRAWDAVRGVVVASAELDTQGAYSLSLPAGHYVLLLDAADTTGHYLAPSRPFVIGGACDEPALAVDVDAGQPEPFDAAWWNAGAKMSTHGLGARAFGTRSDALTGCGALPTPRIFVAFVGTTDIPQTRSAAADFCREVAKLADGVDFVCDSDIRTLLGMIAYKDSQGGDSSDILNRVDSMFAGIDFVLGFAVDDTARRKVRAVTTDLSGALVRRKDLDIGPAGTSISRDNIVVLARATAMPSLKDALRSREELPIDPRLKVALAPQLVPPGRDLVITGKLSDVDCSPGANKSIRVEVIQNHTANSVTAMTGADGTFNVAVRPSPNPGLGTVQAIFRKQVGTETRTELLSFEVEAPQNVGVSLTSTTVSVHPGETALIALSVSDPTGKPVANADVALRVPFGEVTPEVTTDAQGRATALFRASRWAGAVKIDATVTAGGSGTASFELMVEPALAVNLAGEVAHITGDGVVPLSGSVTANGVGLAGVTVTATSSEGTLAATSTVTNDNGDFALSWTSPPSGSGQASLVASVSDDGDTFAAPAATIGYGPSMCPTPTPPPAYFVGDSLDSMGGSMTYGQNTPVSSPSLSLSWGKVVESVRVSGSGYQDTCGTVEDFLLIVGSNPSDTRPIRVNFAVRVEGTVSIVGSGSGCIRVSVDGSRLLEMNPTASTTVAMTLSGEIGTSLGNGFNPSINATSDANASDASSSAMVSLTVKWAGITSVVDSSTMAPIPGWQVCSASGHDYSMSF